jgi:drug/metabolite transporter (DMT)-like permease
VAVALLGALLAALCYGGATILQSLGTSRFLAASHEPLWSRIWAGRLYLGGLALDGVGFLASVAALRTLPLFDVQSAVAASVGVTAALAVWLLHETLTPREVLAVILVGLGLVTLAVTAAPGPAVRIGGPARWAALAGAVLLGVLVLLLGPIPPRVRGPVAGVFAGLGFAGVGMCARVLDVPRPWWHLVEDPTAWALLTCAAFGTAAFARALALSGPTRVAAITFSVETVLPAGVGLLWLGDAVRPGLSGLAVVAFVAILVGCIVLARHVPE